MLVTAGALKNVLLVALRIAHYQKTEHWIDFILNYCEDLQRSPAPANLQSKLATLIYRYPGAPYCGTVVRAG